MIEAERPTAGADGRWPSAAEWRVVLTNRTLLANYWSFFVFGYFLFFFFTWMPSYLTRVFHLDLTAVGLYAILPWVAAVVAVVAAGHMSDRILARSGSLRKARSVPIWTTHLVAGLAVVPLAVVHDLWLAVICMSLAIAAALAANPVFLAVNADVVPRRQATAVGVMESLLALAGFVAPTITGYALEFGGTYGHVFLLIAGLALSSVVVTLLLHRPDDDRVTDS